MLVLHGFPSASHQFRRLIDALGGRYRLIAPDYPGFGHTDAPTSATVGGSFTYTFDRLAHVIEGFCKRLGLDRFVMYIFDFGVPVGFRLAERLPYLFYGREVKVHRAELLVQLSEKFTNKDATGTTLTLTSPDRSAFRFDLPAKANLGNLLHKGLEIPEVKLEKEKDWTLSVTSVAPDLADSHGRLNPDAVEDIGLVVHYKVG